MIKNPQFKSNQPEIKAILPTHGLVFLTKFHYNCAKIVDSLLLANFLGRIILFVTVSILSTLLLTIWYQIPILYQIVQKHTNQSIFTHFLLIVQSFKDDISTLNLITLSFGLYEFWNIPFSPISIEVSIQIEFRGGTFWHRKIETIRIDQVSFTNGKVEPIRIQSNSPFIHTKCLKKVDNLTFLYIKSADKMQLILRLLFYS